MEEVENANLELGLETYQGMTQAADVAKLIDIHTQDDEPMVMCAMAQDLCRILLAYSFVKYYGSRMSEPDFDDKLMGAWFCVRQYLSGRR